FFRVLPGLLREPLAQLAHLLSGPLGFEARGVLARESERDVGVRLRPLQKQASDVVVAGAQPRSRLGELILRELQVERGTRQVAGADLFGAANDVLRRRERIRGSST